MPKEHPKQVRNCVNETQFRDEKTGRFLQRRDDGEVTRCPSRSKMYAETVHKLREQSDRNKRRRALRYAMAA